jgi:hypothetical protein
MANAEGQKCSGLPSAACRSRTKSWSKSQVTDIKFTDFQTAEIHAIEVLLNLFEPDVFATKDFTDKD